MSRGHFVGVDYHKRLLSDSERNEAFQAAIEAQVEPSMVVVDVGTGTGILALMAARAGARKVYAIEPAPIIQVAQIVAEHNGYSDVIEFIQADSRQVNLPERCDLLISECLGNFFVSDEMQPVMRDAVRFLKPTAVSIPRSVTLKLAPASLPLFQGIRFFHEPCLGFDLSPIASFARNRAYVLQVEPELLIGEAARFAKFALLEAPDTIESEFVLQINRAMTLDGVVGWFEAELGGGVVLSTAPGNYTHWGQTVFPLPSTSVQPGDIVAGSLRLTMDPETYRSSYCWRGEIRRSGQVLQAFDHDTAQRFSPAQSAPR